MKITSDLLVIKKEKAFSILMPGDRWAGKGILCLYDKVVQTNHVENKGKKTVDKACSGNRFTQPSIVTYCIKIFNLL